jgi:hypothetical protein
MSSWILVFALISRPSLSCVDIFLPDVTPLVVADIEQPAGFAVMIDSKTQAAFPKNTPTRLFVVAARSNGEIADKFTGTIHLSTTDRFATIPSSIELRCQDGGIQTIDKVVFGTEGDQIITASDGNVRSTLDLYIRPNVLEGPVPTRLGDIDGNGVVDFNDVELLLSYLANSATLNPIQVYAADLDRNGYATSDDLDLLVALIDSDLEDKHEPRIRIVSPVGDADRSFTEIELFYEDVDSGIDPSSLLIFNNRHLDSDHLLSGPGTNLLKPFGLRQPDVEVGDSAAFIRLPPNSFDVGLNTLTAVIADRSGNIGVSVVTFNVIGVHVLSRSRTSINRPGYVMLSTNRDLKHMLENGGTASWSSCSQGFEILKTTMHSRSQLISAVYRYGQTSPTPFPAVFRADFQMTDPLGGILSEDSLAFALGSCINVE